MKTRQKTNEELIADLAVRYPGFPSRAMHALEALCNRADQSVGGASILVNSNEARRVLPSLHDIGLSVVSKILERKIHVENEELKVGPRKTSGVPMVAA